uniref:Helicase C-terminal domain-containing protein n=2 Tax=Rhodosorus marinus TaxID=101924 RepID=A0A7S2ZQI7_9RHOD|mmetsp:Transcript_28237/g.110897  ORF Transcript_28237/g.110897 Transcript_28237/m.110897 type:complete len:311 (+) Transcript_28237:677-1609(+)
MQHVNAFNVDFLDLQYIILDEVDTLFEGGFANDLESIVKQVRKRKGEDCSLQFIAAGATHPTSARQLYTKLMPSAKYINVDLHKAPPGLTQRFIHTTPGEKTRELTALLGDAENDGTLRGGRIIIFTNTTESCRFLDHFLNEKDYSTSCIHGEMPRDRRGIEFQKFADRKTQLLVGTDVAARGLDNLAVDHVILFDFPASPVDYIHRAGRTARAGAKGRVSSFVTKKDRTLAEAIEQANKDETDALAQAHQKRLESDRIKAEKGRLGKLARARMEKERGNQGYGKNTNDGKDHRQGKGRILKTKLSPKRR